MRQAGQQTIVRDADPRLVTAQGFGPEVWQPTVRRAPVLSLPRRMTGERVLIAAAHADDETLGAAGLIQAMHRRGARFVVLVGTDGAAAFPGLDEERRRELVSERERETSAALHELGLREHEVTFLRLPDGAASDHHEQLAAALTAVGAGCSWWLAPWRDDPHPDHQAVGRAAVQSLPHGARLVEYPIWMRHSISPGDPRVPRAALRTIRLNRGQHRRKLAAIDAHRSQTQVWDTAYAPVLPGHVLSLFRGRHEPFFLETP